MYQIQNKEIVIDGWQNGIGVSPHKGIANIQAGNISTENGEVMCNFDRTKAISNATITGSFSFYDSYRLNTTVDVPKGVWITVNTTSDAGQLATGSYYVLISSTSTGLTRMELSSTYGGNAITTYTNVSGTFTLSSDFSEPRASATEPYFDGTTQQYRYYITDKVGKVWVHDTAYDSIVPEVWFNPDPVGVTSNNDVSGLEVLNGWLMIFYGTTIACKPTVKLGTSFSSFAPGIMSSGQNHYALVGNQGRLYYCDGVFIGSIEPNTTNLTLSGVNVQSYAKYTASGSTITISTLIGGSYPEITGYRIPVAFFTTGVAPTDITVGTIYYLQKVGVGQYDVYTALTGGSTKDMSTGASGNQYFNTYYPVSASGSQTIIFTKQRLTLPFHEKAQVLGEVGNNIIVGGRTNMLYPWNQIDAKPQDLIPLPESDAVNMITVNNMIYVFAGNKGNIYVTNGSTASLVLSVPDYCAGIDGTPASYVEPYFTWGDAIYVRGRVWFSIKDQVSAVSPFPAKAGNCGGIWSFVPTQNFFYGQDTGLSLRLENRSSYGSYNGYCPVLIGAQIQTDRSPQYYSAWSNGSTGYGIDYTGDTVTTPAVIDTDLIPTGTMLDKKTFNQIEYKLSAPLTTGESVAISYRQNSTDAFTSCGTFIVESTTSLSGYVPVNFQKGQWLQLRITLTPNGNTGSFVRLRQVIVR